jgi:hypothetical protein
MTRQSINIGSGPNDKSGDPLRTAFNKINNNFTELYSGLPALSISSTPPLNPAVGQQWWDSTDGNSYIFYNGNWVPSTSTVALQSSNIRSVVGNTININFAADGIITSALTGNVTVNFANYTLGAKVRLILSASSTSYIVTTGVPASRSTNGGATVQASNTPSTIMLEYTCTSTSISGVYVKIN